ncbi:FHA domain-containing protein [Parendozoicomonas sp. Alg238-R29]|uniref:FHA domain-containing protein n=1 Tax=Parendozoicomonas sp. Alg238-R29 TaxID=2993446 RepID=UPI00248DD20C|nr:FHA domain-containing protein [Parendozoicomonas sp. Alg238-R29]
MLTLTMIAWPEQERPTGQVLTLPVSGGLIGRGENCAVHLLDSSRVLSRQHCEISRYGNDYRVCNLSRNGLQVNGESIVAGTAGQRKLYDGDLLTLGEYRLLVSNPAPEKSKTTDVIPEPAIVDEAVLDEAVLDEGVSGEVFSNDLLSHSKRPPVLTERVVPDTSVADTSSSVAGDTFHIPDQFSTESSENMILSSWEGGRSAPFSHGLAGIDALADEMLREFSPERLEHKLAPWRGKGWRRQSWWKLYRSYHQQLERTGELHVRLREWVLRSGGLGSGGG